jgi:DUF1009 family protein
MQCVQLLDALLWPPDSPELNSIQCLWGTMKRRLSWSDIRKRGDTTQAVKIVWQLLGEDSIDALVRSLANHIQEMKDTKGKTK